MKKTKRLAAALAALAMAVSMMTVSVYAYADPEPAEGSTNVTADTADTAHTFVAYPIFLGTVDGTELSGAELGSFTLDQLITAARITNTTADLNDVLAAIEEMENNSAAAIAFAKALAANTASLTTGINLGTAATELQNGYYLIVEKNTVNSKVLNANILKLVGGNETLNISAKTDYPKLVKKVGEENATEDANYGKQGDYKYNDVADHSITETVPFKLYGTMPGNIAMYDHYMYKITDTFDTGLTVDPASVKVYIGETLVYSDATKETAAAHGLTVSSTASTAAAAGSLVINFVDIKVYGVTADSKITVEYTGCLNANAVPATGYQENGAKLTYSLNYDSDVVWTPYEDTTGEKPNTDNPTPGKPNYPDTPGGSGEETPNGDEETNNGGDTPEDKVILYTYELQIQKTDSDGTAITGTAAQAAEFTVKQGDNYIAVDENGKVTSISADEAKINLDADGKLTVIGLDDGTYTITEVTPPTGYRLPTNNTYTVTIVGGIVTSQTWDTFAPAEAFTVASQTITAPLLTDPAVDANGVYTAKLPNSAIGSLPSTGGIGTGIFIVGGGSIALASGIILIAKKRSKKED